MAILSHEVNRVIASFASKSLSMGCNYSVHRVRWTLSQRKRLKT